MEARESVSTVLAHLRERRGMNKSDLARAVEVTQSYISQVEAGATKLTLATTEKIIEALRLSDSDAERLRDAVRWERTSAGGRELIDKILKSAAEMGVADKVVRVEHIPILHEIPVGEAMKPAEEYPAAGYIPVPSAVLAEYPGCFAFILRDDSMSPRFVEDTAAVAAPGLDPIEGHPAVGVIFHDPGESKMTCRRWFRNGDTVTLTAENPTFPPMVMTAKEVAWAHPVVWSGRREL